MTDVSSNVRSPSSAGLISKPISSVENLAGGLYQEVAIYALANNVTVSVNGAAAIQLASNTWYVWRAPDYAKLLSTFQITTNGTGLCHIRLVT